MARHPRSRWNHNLHYHRLVLDAVPDGAVSALDVGTGDGLLARDLREVVPDVTAIDVDVDVIKTARREAGDVDVVLGDVMTYDLGRRFDVVASVATLHHLGDLPTSLRRLADLTAPGGALVVVGLARSTWPRDFIIDLVGALHHRYLLLRREFWEHSAPTLWPPPHTYADVRDAARTQLPGARWRRLTLFRYALIWHKPQ